MTKRYIFLDFDGVINTLSNKYRRAERLLPLKDDLGPFFDLEAVKNLDELIAETGADIVVTSTWRYKGLEAMQQLWLERGMPGKIVGLTPMAAGVYLFQRGTEVMRWLYDEGLDDTTEYRYVIIDDGDDFMPEQLPYTIITDPYIGLTASDCQKAIKILTQE